MTVFQVRLYIVAFTPFVPGTQHQDSVLRRLVGNDFQCLLDMVFEVRRGGVDIDAVGIVGAWRPVPAARSSSW